MPIYQDSARDAADLAKGMNEDVTFNTRYGVNPKKSFPRAVREIETSGTATINQIQNDAANAIATLNTSRGFRVVGDFASGFTYELPNDVAIDGSGNYWVYADINALPVTVTAGTTPSAPTYTQTTFSQASAVTTTAGINAQEFIDNFELKTFQSPTDNLTKVTAFAGGVGVVYEVRKASDNSLATIYSDKDGVTSIPQNGTANVSNGDAEAVFYIADGDYTVTINAVSAIFSAGAKHFRVTTSDVSAGLYDAGSLVILSDRDEGVFEVVSGGAANGANILNAGGGNTATLVSDIVTVGMFGGDKAAAVSYVNNKPSLLMIGKNYFTKGSANNTLIKVAEDGTATRVHIEPNGYIQTGTTSKLDLMFDDYEQDPVNYRIAAMFAETGDMPHLYGENGRAVLNIKGTGQQWGVWPSWGLGFQDGTRVPMKAFLYDTSDTEWRTPQKGMWRTSVGYTLGDYVLSEFKLYKATNSGTSGANAPIHGSGTVSDGAVSWEFVRDYQATIASHDTCVIFGSVDDMPMFGQFDIPVQYHGHTVHKNGFRDKWLKNDGTSLLAWAGVRSDSNSYQIEMSDSSTFQLFEGWYRATRMAESLWSEVEGANATTVDVGKLQKIVMSNTAATTVTAFINARANQSLYVESTNGNTTIQHNSDIRLKGAADVTLDTDSMLHFVRHSDGRFIQV